MDLGQGEQRWVVLADPEGNEFCVLAPRRVTATGAQSVESVPQTIGEFNRSWLCLLQRLYLAVSFSRPALS